MNRKSLPVGRRGFTLMELVITVAVILVLILLALLVLNPKASIDKAYDAHRKKDLENLKIAFENYYSDYACYPIQEQINNCDSNDLDPYIKEIPCDPVLNIPYELIAEPASCPINFIAYTWLKKDSSCLSIGSPNATPNPDHDCTEYFSAFTPTGTPTPTSTPSPTPSSSPTPSPTPDIPYYYCSSLDNCTQLPEGRTCNPNFPWPDTSCSGACSNPSNICVPQ